MEIFHLVTSTGQNVTNFIPLLELAKKTDPIIVISSNFAERKGLTQRLQNVLHKRGFSRVQKLIVSDFDILNFHKLKKHIFQYFQSISNIKEIYFYLNGGQKIGSLATSIAISKFPVKYIYMDTKSIQITIANSENTSYHPIYNDIHLEEILEINNTRIIRGEKIYNDGIFQYTPEHGEKILAFGRDKNFSYELLQLVHRINDKKGSLSVLVSNKDYYKWLKKRILSTRNEKIELIKNNVEELINYVLKNGFNEKNKDVIANNLNKISNILESIIDWAISLPQNKISDYLKYSSEPIVLSDNELKYFKKFGLKFEKELKHFSFGRFFEIVTTWRLIKFLKDNHKLLNLISEIWTNVEFEAIENPGKATGEYDILIVLKNGLLIALECKTLNFEEKDLFARIARLMQRGGLLSEFWIILPIFTDENFNNVLKRQYKLYANFMDLGMTLIPFTLLKQPSMLKLPNTEQEFEVITFENKLNSLLERYLMVD